MRFPFYGGKVTIICADRPSNFCMSRSLSNFLTSYAKYGILMAISSSITERGNFLQDVRDMVTRTSTKVERKKMFLTQALVKSVCKGTN